MMRDSLFGAMIPIARKGVGEEWAGGAKEATEVRRVCSEAPVSRSAFAVFMLSTF